MPRPSHFYKIRVAKAEDGERLPILVDADSLLPLVEPNQYVLRAKRPRCEVSTMENTLRHLAILHAWCDWHKIDIRRQIADFGSLSLRQIDDLIEDLRIDFNEIVVDEKIRELAPAVVENATWAARITSIRDHLIWHIDEHISV